MTHRGKESPVYTVAFGPVALTSATTYELLSLLASSLSRVAVHKLELGARTTATASETVGVTFFRGTTSTGAGAALTPRNIDGYNHVASAGSIVNGPSSVNSSTASAVPVFATAWHYQDDTLNYEPRDHDDRITLEAGQRLHVKMTQFQSNNGFDIFGTLQFSEIGNVPSYTVSPTAKS